MKKVNLRLNHSDNQQETTIPPSNRRQVRLGKKSEPPSTDDPSARKPKVRLPGHYYQDTEEELFQLDKYIKVDCLNPENLPPQEWAKAIGFTFNMSGQLCGDPEINCLTKNILAVFHNVVRSRDNYLAIYNKDGYYELVSSGVRGQNALLLPSIICSILNYHETFPLWNYSLEQQIIKAMFREVTLNIKQWGRGEYLALDNGMYILENRELVPHSKDYYNTYKLPIRYQPETTCPRFLKFIEEITLGDQALADNLQEIVGYILSNSDKASVAFFWVSDGSSGKSTLGNVIEALVGTDNISSVSLSTLNMRFGLESMLDKKLNLSNESDVSGSFNAERLKALTTNEKIEIDRKGRPAVTTKLSIKLLFMCNRLPELSSDTKYSMERRLHIVPFPARFTKDKADIHLTQKLLKELPGILNWALIGLYRLQSNTYHFTPCPAIQNAVHNYITTADPVLHFFETHYKPLDIPTNDGLIIKSSVYERYNVWCRNTKKPCVSRNQFWKTLTNYYDRHGLPIETKKKYPGKDYITNYQEIPTPESQGGSYAS